MKVWIAESLDNGIEHVFDSREKAVGWLMEQLQWTLRDYLDRYGEDCRNELTWVIDALESIKLNEPFIEDVAHVYEMEIE